MAKIKKKSPDILRQKGEETFTASVSYIFRNTPRSVTSTEVFTFGIHPVSLNTPLLALATAAIKNTQTCLPLNFNGC